MKTENKLGVALVKELCPSCCTEMDGPIVMNKMLTEHHAGRVEEMHGKVVGFADHICPECKKLVDDNNGIIWIGVDAEKTEDMNNPWRTGLFVVTTKDYAKRVMQPKMYAQVEKLGMTFVEQSMAERLGLTGKA